MIAPYFKSLWHICQNETKPVLGKGMFHNIKQNNHALSTELPYL